MQAHQTDSTVFGQTNITQLRSLLKEQSGQGLHYLTFHYFLNSLSGFRFKFLTRT